MEDLSWLVHFRARSLGPVTGPPLSASPLWGDGFALLRDVLQLNLIKYICSLNKIGIARWQMSNYMYTRSFWWEWKDDKFDFNFYTSEQDREHHLIISLHKSVTGKNETQSNFRNWMWQLNVGTVCLAVSVPVRREAVPWSYFYSVTASAPFIYLDFVCEFCKSFDSTKQTSSSPTLNKSNMQLEKGPQITSRLPWYVCSNFYH